MDAVTVLQTVLSAIQTGSIGGLNVSDVISSANVTVGTTTSSLAATSFSPLQIPALVFKLWTVSAVRDWLKLLLMGAALEFCRRSVTTSWDAIRNYFWITVTLDEGDDCGYWLMYWLSKHHVFRTARTLDVSTRTFGIDTPVMSESATIDDISKGRRISFLPSLETTYSLWFKYRYVTVTRNQVNDSPWHTRNNIHIRMLTRNHELLRELLLEAKKMYYTASKNMISIYVCDNSDYWKLMCTQPKRPMRSIILDPGVIELVMNDAKDFLASKEWYAERGIPHRRGYLLYGAPGSGKTSLIHSIAGELNLDVYILSLTRLGMDDSSLNSTIAELPSECIVLIEDIDAAFHQGIKRDIADPEKQKGADGRTPPNPAAPKENSDSVCRITLSGLLNALDGIGAQEGRILFATTNDHTALDPALCRPGRLDLHIGFKLASKYQCRELFRRFYLPGSLDTDEEETREDKDEKDSGYSSRAGSTKGDDASAPSTPPPSTPSTDAGSDAGEITSAGATYVGIAHSLRAPKLSRRQAAELADAFAAAIPHRAFSMATLQGYLMTYKTRPHEALAAAPAWVAKKARESQAGKREDAPEPPGEDAVAAAPEKEATSSAEQPEVKKEDGESDVSVSSSAP